MLERLKDWWSLLRFMNANRKATLDMVKGMAELFFKPFSEH